MAINQYLCDTAEYDMDALENAEENDFAGVDAKFNDSFTPYGVLLNKTGGVFKLCRSIQTSGAAGRTGMYRCDRKSGR